MTSHPQLRREVSRYSLMLHDAGWVANHDGNVSIKEGARVFVTPTGVSKRLCTPETIVECDLAGKPLGRGKPPSEISLHLGAYRAREEIAAVIHAHPPHATAFALVGRTIDPIAMPEVAVSLGERVPLVPMFVPKDPGAAAAIQEALAWADVALMAGNGAIAVGPDLETAYLRMELLEHYARILTIARGGVGEPAALPDSAQQKCLELRKAAGLHREAPRAGGTSDTRRVVMEEVRRALGDNK
jgi:L-fuculose-phosphate aldolase